MWGNYSHQEIFGSYKFSGGNYSDGEVILTFTVILSYKYEFESSLKDSKFSLKVLLFMVLFNLRIYLVFLY